VSRQYEDATLRIKGDLAELFQMLDALEKRLDSIGSKFGGLGGGGGAGASPYSGGAYGGGSTSGGFDGSRIGDRNLAFTGWLNGGLNGAPSVATPPPMSPGAQGAHGGGYGGGGYLTPPPPPGGGGGGPTAPAPLDSQLTE
jgi:hypothetical protein